MFMASSSVRCGCVRQRVIHGFGTSGSGRVMFAEPPITCDRPAAEGPRADDEEVMVVSVAVPLEEEEEEEGEEGEATGLREVEEVEEGEYMVLAGSPDVVVRLKVSPTPRRGIKWGILLVVFLKSCPSKSTNSLSGSG